jgi:molybdopterin-guanine dinucleotide biosynthesis protein A
MVRRAVAALRPVVTEIIVVSSRPVPETQAPVVPDITEGAGPLGGLEAALLEAERRGLEGVLLLACDLPLMVPEVVERVAAAARGRTAVAPVRSGGEVEPLCAAYAVGCLDAVRRRLTSDDRSLRALFRDVGGAVLPTETAADEARYAFLNVNTPSDRDRAEAALRERGDG